MTKNRPPRRNELLLGLAIAMLVLATACSRIASPDGWASPRTSGSLILASHQDELFALDASDLDGLFRNPELSPGTISWKLSSDDTDEKIEALYGDPTIGDGLVYVPTHQGTFYALEIENGGAIHWSYETGGSLIGGSALAGETIYFGSSDGNVYALAAQSGDFEWEFPTGDQVWSAPAVSGGTVYATSLDGRLYAIDAASGDELWSYKTSAGIAAPPVVDEASGTVFVAGLDGKLRAINIDTQDERWQVKANNWFWTRPLVAGGIVYAGSLDGRVYAVDIASGDPVWDRPFETEAAIRAAPVLVAGVLYVIDRDGFVHGIGLSDGLAVDSALDLQADVLTNPFVFAGAAGDEILAVTRDGDLIRIDPANLSEIDRVRLKD